LNQFFEQFLGLLDLFYLEIFQKLNLFQLPLVFVKLLVLVEVDSETGDEIIKTILNVREKDEIEDPLSQISEEEAKKINPDLRVGDFIETGFMEYNPVSESTSTKTSWPLAAGSFL
jgi:hypothetical protein